MKVFISIIIFFAIFFLLSATSFADKEPLRVGFIAPFSGEAQIYGVAARNGFEMALDELGRDWIEVFYEDDQFKAAKTVSAFNKLSSGKGVHLMISVASTPSSAVAPLAQRANIPLAAWASDRRVSYKRSYVLRTYPSGFAEGAAVAKEAKNRGYKRYGLFISQNDYAQSWQGGFEASVAKSDLLVSEELNPDLRDFKPMLLKARARGVSHYAICLNPGKSAIFAKQARELGINAPFFGCENLHDSEEVKLANGALDGAWFSTIAVTDDFRKKYLKKFGNENVISGAANHYDLAYILHKVASSDANGSSLLKAIEASGTHTGAVGEFKVVKTDNDQFFDIPLVIKSVKELS